MDGFDGISTRHSASASPVRAGIYNCSLLMTDGLKLPHDHYASPAASTPPLLVSEETKGVSVPALLCSVPALLFSL